MCDGCACVLQLDYNVTWQKLKDIFKVVGHVVDVEVLESRKGAAIVQFDSSDDAIKAIGVSLWFMSSWFTIMLITHSPQHSFVSWTNAHGPSHAAQNGEHIMLWYFMCFPPQ